MRFIVALLIGLSLALPCEGAPAWDPANMHPIGRVTSVVADAAGATLRCSDGSQVRIVAVAPGVMRVRAALGHALSAYDPSWAVEDLQRHANLTVEERPDAIVLRGGGLTVRVDRNPLRVHILRGDTVICEDALPLRYDKNMIAATQPLGLDTHVYGLGEKAAPLDRRHQQFTMWNYDRPGYVEGQDPIYQSIPFHIARNATAGAHGVFFDNPWRGHYDVAHDQNEHIVFGAEGGEMNYYVIDGPRIEQVLARYADLTGHMPLPPRWALGHQQSRWSYYPQAAVQALVARYAAERLPLDVVYLDIDYMDGYRVFTWDRSRFPTPAALAKSLHDQALHLVTIVDPGVKQDPGYAVYDEGVKRGFFVKRADGTLMVGKVWPGAAVFVDYTLAAARAWWGDLHRVLVGVGVDGIWNDMNEPADFIDGSGAPYMDALFDDHGQRTPYLANRNVFALLMARATFEGLLRLRPDVRPYVITRAAYAGIQRWSTMWTGDNVSTWDHLALTIPMLLDIGLSGEPFGGADVGGFIGRCNGELLTRWYQLAFLTPMCRNHKTRDGNDQEPWRFGQPYEDIIRDTLALRYRLIPYLYTLLDEAHRNGVPPMRPLFMADPDDAALDSVDDAFMVGDALLVAPVLAAGRVERTVYLPRGGWIDWWSGRRFEGHQSVTVPAPLERVPLFVRAGSIIPMAPPALRVDAHPAVLYLDVFPDGDHARGCWYEDDGVTLGYTRGAAQRVEVEATHDAGGWTLRCSEIPHRRLAIRVHRGTAVTEVQSDGSQREIRVPDR